MVDDDVAHGAPLPSTPGGPCLPTRGTHSLGPDFGDAVQRDLGGGGGGQVSEVERSTRRPKAT